MSRPVLVVALGLLSSCQCGDPRLSQVSQDPCLMTPELCIDAGVVPVPVPVEEVDAGAPDAGMACSDLGSVSGRVCATDQQTWVNGATVYIDGTDCNGLPLHLTTQSAADGRFELKDVPPGDWTVNAALGAFRQATPVTVRANAPTAIPDNQLCVAQKTARIAVVTGSGDKIEDLLSDLQLQYSLYGGDSSTWTTQAGPFLADLDAMKQFDLIFIDCAAAKRSGSTIDFGSQAATIQKNLHDYVLQGGSVYSSDWALLFTNAAAPSAVRYATQSGQPVSNPMDAKQLMGFAPQTVTATVTDPGLATFLGKQSLSITFPKSAGANSSHWGLMTSAPGATVLVSASTVTTCSTSACTNAGAAKHQVPLAVHVRLLPPGVKGGNVVYTSFHNIAQSGTDVAQVLKYLVLNL